MTIMLELAPDVESGLNETARHQGNTARQLLAMPAAERSHYLAEAAAHAAPLYAADLALPPEQRELTAIIAINSHWLEKQARG